MIDLDQGTSQVQDFLSMNTYNAQSKQNLQSLNTENECCLGEI